MALHLISADARVVNVRQWSVAELERHGGEVLNAYAEPARESMERLRNHLSNPPLSPVTSAGLVARIAEGRTDGSLRPEVSDVTRNALRFYDAHALWRLLHAIGFDRGEPFTEAELRRLKKRASDAHSRHRAFVEFVSAHHTQASAADAATLERLERGHRERAAIAAFESRRALNRSRDHSKGVDKRDKHRRREAYRRLRSSLGWSHRGMAELLTADDWDSPYPPCLYFTERYADDDDDDNNGVGRLVDVLKRW